MIVKQSPDLDTEHTRISDLWHFLHCAEQLAINHERLHDLIHADLLKCLLVVGEYQDELIDKLHPDSDLINETKAHKQQP